MLLKPPDHTEDNLFYRNKFTAAVILFYFYQTFILNIFYKLKQNKFEQIVFSNKSETAKIHLTRF